MAAVFDSIPDCPVCGTWVCAQCGWKRHRANLSSPHHRCHRCGGADGTLIPTKHYNRITRTDHQNSAAKN